MFVAPACFLASLASGKWELFPAPRSLRAYFIKLTNYIKLYENVGQVGQLGPAVRIVFALLTHITASVFRQNIEIIRLA